MNSNEELNPPDLEIKEKEAYRSEVDIESDDELEEEKTSFFNLKLILITSTLIVILLVVLSYFNFISFRTFGSINLNESGTGPVPYSDFNSSSSSKSKQQEWITFQHFNTFYATNPQSKPIISKMISPLENFTTYKTIADGDLIYLMSHSNQDNQFYFSKIDMNNQTDHHLVPEKLGIPILGIPIDFCLDKSAPNGLYYALGNEIYYFDLKKNESKYSSSTKCDVKSIKLSSDEKQMYYACQNLKDPKLSTIYIKNLGEYQDIRYDSEYDGYLEYYEDSGHVDFLISPQDGKLVLYKFEENNLCFILDGNPYKKFTLENVAVPISSIAFSKDGKGLFIIDNEANLFAIDYKKLLRSEINLVIKMTPSKIEIPNLN